ncbi:hypothetical protein RND71_030626 [Anisodus tanguticus]|uniref:Uncharacterized protein n=1 Tax=Anisodus tanguticus TaxID=243964 RepID=A0AAE1RGR9_9SOLA|nr:hypothetical protein RND71_030626 [Anisodus tanguticus]
MKYRSKWLAFPFTEEWADALTYVDVGHRKNRFSNFSGSNDDIEVDTNTENVCISYEDEVARVEEVEKRSAPPTKRKTDAPSSSSSKQKKPPLHPIKLVMVIELVLALDPIHLMVSAEQQSPDLYPKHDYQLADSTSNHHPQQHRTQNYISKKNELQLERNFTLKLQHRISRSRRVQFEMVPEPIPVSKLGL